MIIEIFDTAIDEGRKIRKRLNNYLVISPTISYLVDLF